LQAALSAFVQALASAFLSWQHSPAFLPLQQAFCSVLAIVLCVLVVAVCADILVAATNIAISDKMAILFFILKFDLMVIIYVYRYLLDVM
jgi:hypothetical protein